MIKKVVTDTADATNSDVCHHFYRCRRHYQSLIAFATFPAVTQFCQFIHTRHAHPPQTCHYSIAQMCLVIRAAWTAGPKT